MHRDDPVRVGEDHVHVVLDDDGGDPARSHDRGHDVHDRRLLAGAHAAGGLVEEEELGPERVRHGHVQELALALGEPAGQHPRLRLQAEPLQHLAGLVEHGPVALGQGRHPPCLALPGEDRERDVVLYRHLVEQVDELEAPRDPLADALVDGLACDVRAVEDDAARVGTQEPADQVHQRGLPGAVGADQPQQLTLVHDEVHVIHGVGVAEPLPDPGGLEQGHVRRSAGAGRRAARGFPRGRPASSAPAGPARRRGPSASRP